MSIATTIEIPSAVIFDALDADCGRASATINADTAIIRKNKGKFINR
jgi:hypothetical protein